MGGAAAEDDSLNWLFAAHTRLAFAVVDSMKKLKATLFAVGIDIIPQRTAAVVYGAAENEFDSAVEAKDLLPGKSIGGSGRVNAAVEEGFIGVYIADAGHEALIEQGGLDGAASLGQTLGELSRTNFQRLGAEICVICLTIAEPPDAAEAPGIPKTKLKMWNLRFEI